MPETPQTTKTSWGRWMLDGLSYIVSGRWLKRFLSDRPPSQGAKETPGSGAWNDLGRVVFVLYLGMIVGAIVVACHAGLHACVALLWALACFAVGALIGFLFGIPRVVQREGAKVEDSPEQGAAQSAGAEDYQQRVNTNLEQISDWLTKIIVGIGLIELKNVPGHLESVAAYASRCFGENVCLAFAGALIVYFFLLGFFSGYLLTRLFLSKAFANADRISLLQKQVREMRGRVEARQDKSGDASDPQKGAWGGSSTANRRVLTAKTSPNPSGSGTVQVDLEVKSTDPNVPLVDTVTFHLHPGLIIPDFDRTVAPEGGIARTRFVTSRAFTVGAETDNSKTKLELDLSTVQGFLSSSPTPLE
jgi:hypothetical protein